MRSTRTKRGAALAVAALLALPAAVLAQGMAGHRAGSMSGGPAAMGGAQAAMPGGCGMGGGMMGSMMGGGMMALGPTAADILAQKDALGLTEEQTTRLDSLQGRTAEAWQAHRAMMQGIHQQMSELRQAEKPDLDRYQKLMQQMASAGAAMHVQVAKIGQEAEQVLTPDQRSKVRYAMKLMGQRGGMGSGGMMGRGSMMGRGMMGSSSGMMGNGMMGGSGSMMGRGSMMGAPGSMRGSTMGGSPPCAVSPSDSQS
ncbi:MAG TPA: Spy/CpxP family protein refolding chaperone [Gemmatimonadota bacterium]|nr:Spy/CpxP family protein refolding chaperone [Gemmatimonadota bacterium]